MGGGAPLISGGQVIAGVGVSGGTVEQDIAILEAGFEKPNSRLGSAKHYRQGQIGRIEDCSLKKGVRT